MGNKKNEVSSANNLVAGNKPSAISFIYILETELGPPN